MLNVSKWLYLCADNCLQIVAVKGYDLASQGHALSEFNDIIVFPAHHGLPQTVSSSLLM